MRLSLLPSPASSSSWCTGWCSTTSSSTSGSGTRRRTSTRPVRWPRPTPSAPPFDRRQRIEQIVVTQLRRDARGPLHHLPHRDRRSALRVPRRAAEDAPLLQRATGRPEKNGKWERRHKFSDFGCTVCHDGQGRGLEAFDSAWRRPLLAGSAARLRHPGQLARRTSSPQAQGQGVHAGQLRPVPHGREASPGTPLVTKGRQLFFENNCYGCHHIEGICRRHPRTGPERGRQEVQERLHLGIDRRSACESRHLVHAEVQPDRRRDVRSLVVFLKSRKGRNFAETEISALQGEAHGGRRAGAGHHQARADQSRPRWSSRASSWSLERACTACHKLGERRMAGSPRTSASRGC